MVSMALLGALIGNGTYLFLILKILVNILFASAVARDIGELTRRHRKPILTSGFVWVLATLVGGVFVAAVYWFMHHWPRARTYIENRTNDK